MNRLFIFIIYAGFFPILLLGNVKEEDSSGTTFTVVIDAGHGGKDYGAIGTKANEKDIALKIALKTGEYINKYLPEVKVIYTRTTDIFIPLHERAEIANNANAQLFISVHVNSNENTKAYGTSSHVLGLHRAGENFEVAKRENSVILMEDDHSTRYQNFDPNSPESYIIFSVLQNIYLKQSIDMAAEVQDQFRDRAGRKDRGVKQQGLLVLAQTSMPGLLIETGFISNPDEEKYLITNEGQEYIASAIFRAFRDYKNNIELKSEFEPFPAENNTYPDNEKENTVQLTDESAGNNETKQNVKISAVEINDNNIGSDSSTDDIIYKVQISSSVSKMDINSGFFKGISDIGIIESDGVFKYVVGNDTSFSDIKDICSKIKDKFPDAFIIAIKQGKIIPLQQALSEASLKNKNIN